MSVLPLDYSLAEMRRRKHNLRTTLASGQFVGCDGRLYTLYARVEGSWKSVGTICRACGEIELDSYPGEVWQRRGVGRDVFGQVVDPFDDEGLD